MKYRESVCLCVCERERERESANFFFQIWFSVVRGSSLEHFCVVDFDA